MDLELPDDVMAWVDGKVRMLGPGYNRARAVAWILGEAMALERHRHTMRFDPDPPRDPNDAWANLAAQARRKADGR